MILSGTVECGHVEPDAVHSAVDAVRWTGVSPDGVDSESVEAGPRWCDVERCPCARRHTRVISCRRVYFDHVRAESGLRIDLATASPCPRTGLEHVHAWISYRSFELRLVVRQSPPLARVPDVSCRDRAATNWPRMRRKVDMVTEEAAEGNEG